MRVAIWRCAAFGLLLVLAAQTVAQPPLPSPLGQPGQPDPYAPYSPGKLKSDTAALTAELNKTADAGNGTERAKLQAELAAILKRINSMPANPGVLPKPAGPLVITKPKTEPLDPSKAVDPLRTAMNLFRDDDFDAALQTFRQLDLTQMAREDRAFVRYMVACCLRRMGRTPEAITIFTEVANSKEDEFTATCAVSQLSFIRSGQELEAQLEQLRARSKPR